MKARMRTYGIARAMAPCGFALQTRIFGVALELSVRNKQSSSLKGARA